jgi:uncharacterized protein (TIGR02145 family)
MVAAIILLLQVAIGAQTDTAYVPFVVNANATVRAAPNDGTAAAVPSVQISVTANTQATLRIPLPKSTGVRYGAQKQTAAPAIIRNIGGKVTINLPANSYKNAKISLYSMDGKRILRKNVPASSAVSSVSRLNIATGAYILSVKGADGVDYKSRLTHGERSLDINVAFGGENPPPAQQLAKEAAIVDYTVTVSAAGYVEHVYALNPVEGTNPLQNITLRTASGGGGAGTFTDGRNGKTYRTATIGGKTWMAENLNYQTPDSSWCYDNSADNCNKYGRLYAFNAAMKTCPAGWHLPSRAEWDNLAESVGGQLDTDYESRRNWLYAGRALKSTSGWFNSGNGTDAYGFTALPGGMRNSTGGFSNAGVGDFSNLGGTGGFWWTSTEGLTSTDGAPTSLGTAYAYARGIYFYSDFVDDSGSFESYGYSVRCIRN